MGELILGIVNKQRLGRLVLQTGEESQMRRCIVLLLLAAVVAVPSLAFADAQTINFRCVMQYCNDQFMLLANEPFYNPETADWTFVGGRGILDVDEFGLMSLILANPAAPHHEAIHTAFTYNATTARYAIGGATPTATGTIIALTTSPETSGPTARQPIPGTSPVEYYGVDALMGCYLTMGEWGTYDETMCAFRSSPIGGSLVVWPKNYWHVPSDKPAHWDPKPGLQEELRLNYDFTCASWLGMCDDADGDGVSNCLEYWAADPFAYNNAIIWQANPAEAVTWAVWPCMDENNSSMLFRYNTANDRVYIASAGEMTYDEAVAHPGVRWGFGPKIQVRLAEIRSAAENAYVQAAANQSTAWIGCTDHGHDTGDTAGPVNKAHWHWLSTPEVMPMIYQNWDSGEPNGVNGGEDYGEIKDDGKWNDCNKGSVEDPRMSVAVWESIGTYADTTGENEAPDAFEDLNGDLAPDGLSLPWPDADFEADVLSGDMPLEVQFTDLSTGNGETITAWAWDFDNNGTVDSTVQHPTHIYMAADPSSTYTVKLTVTTVNDSPDVRTDTMTKANYIGPVIYVCSWGWQMENQAEVVAANPASVNAALVLALGGADAWIEWDLDGDSLPDAAQIALLAYVACTSWHPLSLPVYSALDANDVLWREQFEGNTVLLDNAEFFTGMVGLSVDMQDALGTILVADLSGYAIYGLPSKVEAPFSAGGDFDGDDLTNLEEWDAVVAYLGSGASSEALTDMFIDAATDPGNFGPYNPDLPVAGIVGLGLLVGSMLAGAALAFRKK